MSFMVFLILFWFLLIWIPLKKRKKGVIFLQESRSDVAWDPRECNMAHKATWQCHVNPRERLRRAEVVRTRGRATRVHVDTRVAPRGKRVFGLVSDGPTGIVGPCKFIGVVAQ